MKAPAREARVPIGPLIGLVGAVLLLVSLFLDWWEGLTAFTVFEALDLVLALLALGAILSLAGALGAGLPEGTLPRRELALPLGLAALVIVGSQLLNKPPLVVGTERGPEIGLWLALGGSVLMLAGGLLSAMRISLALDLEPRRSAEREERERGEPEPGGPERGEPEELVEEGPAARRAARRRGRMVRADDEPDAPTARRADPAGEHTTREVPQPPASPPD
jgi:hypothetical protein